MARDGGDVQRRIFGRTTTDYRGIVEIHTTATAGNSNVLNLHINSISRAYARASDHDEIIGNKLPVGITARIGNRTARFDRQQATIQAVYFHLGFSHLGNITYRFNKEILARLKRYIAKA